MGYNTTVMVLNDALGYIEKDPKFGENLAKAIYQKSGLRDKGVDVPAHAYVDGEPRGVHCNAATVIETHHADGTAIVAVGQNYGTKLDECYYVGRHDLYEGQLKILQQLASYMGYRLVKKAPKKELLRTVTRK